MIENFKYKLNRIEKNFLSVLEDLQTIDPDSFDLSFPKIKNKVLEVEKLRKELISECPMEILIKEDEKFLNLAKLIQKTFDDTVERFHNQTERLSNSLANTINQKKLVQYRG